MNSELRQLIQTIHDTPGQAVLISAGAGASAIGWLLAVAGASRTVLEAQIPYSSNSFDRFLGQRPAQYVAARSARLLAGRALMRAQLLSAEQQPLIGLGCSATIATDRVKRGEHRAHVAVWQPQQVRSYHLQFVKGRRDRAEEEQIVSRLLLNALASAFKIDERLVLALDDDEPVTIDVIKLQQALASLLDGTVDFVGVGAAGRLATPPADRPLLSGSFNPLHQGHVALAKHAAAALRRTPVFEISVVNADKAPATQAALLQRIAQFAGRWPLVLTNAPTFADKVRLLGGRDFIVGYDTAQRVLQPRFYDDSAAQMERTLRQLYDSDSRFYVAGRAIDGEYRTFNDLAVPSALRGLFVALPPFRQDISSTELRQQGQRAAH